MRTHQYTECCGGNAANIAVALTRLGTSVRLLTTLGDDPAGVWLHDDLQAHARMDLTWVQQRPRTTTGITHIVVDPTSRTCFHTPGTCGEYDASPIGATTTTPAFWENVVHVHSDTRHATAALAVARMAKKQGSITVSVDVEKDRTSDDFEALVALADIVFTNDAASSYWEQFRDEYSTLPRSFVLGPSLAHLSAQQRQLVQSSTSQPLYCTHSRYQTIVYTHGHHGATRIQRKGGDNGDNFDLDAAGILRDVSVVDTTGAGDALIGGYLHALYHEYPRAVTPNNDGELLLATVDPLPFGCWVAGCKVTREGAQAGLPTRQQVRQQLGGDVLAIQQTLSGKLTLFRSTSLE